MTIFCKASARFAKIITISADFYDFYKISATRFGVCVADVSGKGVPASLLMALCQTNLRHFVKKGQDRLDNPQPDDNLKSIFMLGKQTNRNTVNNGYIHIDVALVDKQTINKIAKEFKPHSKPPVSHHRIVICCLMEIYKFFRLFDEVCLKMKSSGK